MVERGGCESHHFVIRGHNRDLSLGPNQLDGQLVQVNELVWAVSRCTCEFSFLIVHNQRRYVYTDRVRAGVVRLERCRKRRRLLLLVPDSTYTETRRYIGLRHSTRPAVSPTIFWALSCSRPTNVAAIGLHESVR